MMKNLSLIIALTLVSMSASAEFSCPDGADLACLDKGDTVCPASAKCVDDEAVCFDKHPCSSGTGLICESEYDEVLNNYTKTVKQYDQLLVENVGLREQRLEWKNCVINASTLADAERCVR